MEIINYEYELDEISYSLDKYFTENTIFFDIECTGLSPRKSFIYLIGYGMRKDNTITVTQLLAKDESEEVEILTEFENVLNNCSCLLGFNSTRFDESFIVERCRKYKLNTIIKSKKHTDMYLATTKAKCLLDLPNYKQKTIEEFLGLNREDKYNGGELIPVYQHYSLVGDEESKKLILLHNYEDIKGMIYIADILAYTDLLDSNLRYRNHECDNENNKIRFEIKSDISLPCSINKLREYGMYIIKNDCIYVTLNLFKGSLYTFLPDYKNYYYLIDEDMIIPKSIGASMDKNSRRPATRRDCKIQKEDLYLRLPDKLEVSPAIHIFRPDYDSKESYIPISEIRKEILLKIAKYMLKH
jgi:hypothetical protein